MKTNLHKQSHQPATSPLLDRQMFERLLRCVSAPEPLNRIDGRPDRSDASFSPVPYVPVEAPNWMHDPAVRGDMLRKRAATFYPHRQSNGGAH